MEKHQRLKEQEIDYQKYELIIKSYGQNNLLLENLAKQRNSKQKVVKFKRSYTLMDSKESNPLPRARSHITYPSTAAGPGARASSHITPHALPPLSQHARAFCVR